MKVYVEYYGEGMGEALPVDRETPESFTEIISSKDKHRDKKKIFEKVRRRGYWVLRILDEELDTV